MNKTDKKVTRQSVDNYQIIKQAWLNIWGQFFGKKCIVIVWPLLYEILPSDMYLNFEKIKLENSSLMNWILACKNKFQNSGNTGNKNSGRNRLKIQFDRTGFFRNQVQINRGCFF